jgi:putative phosphoesterase
MLIAVVSDTHTLLSPALEGLKRYPADFFCFLGDYYRDGLALARELRMQLVAVMGNGDFREAGYALQLEQSFTVDGVSLFCTHGHRLDVKNGTEALSARARAMGADIALFGHTHYSYLAYRDGCWLMNPGSAAEPRDAQDISMGLIKVQKDAVEFSIISLLDGHLIHGDIWQP